MVWKVKQTSLLSAFAPGQTDPGKPLPHATWKRSVIGGISTFQPFCWASAFRFEKSVGLNCQRLFPSHSPKQKTRAAAFSSQQQLSKRKTALAQMVDSASPAQSFPSMRTAQSHLALGSQREDLLKIFKMERGLSFWQEPGDVNPGVFCPGSLQTFPGVLTTRGCRPFPMLRKVNSTSKAGL